VALPEQGGRVQAARVFPSAKAADLRIFEIVSSEGGTLGGETWGRYIDFELAEPPTPHQKP